MSLVRTLKTFIMSLRMVPFICNPMLSFMDVGCRHVVEPQSCFQVLTFFAPLNHLQFLFLIQLSFLEDNV
jgi:hypothetical protein